jgi:hypothetical protein
MPKFRGEKKICGCGGRGYALLGFVEVCPYPPPLEHGPVGSGRPAPGALLRLGHTVRVNPLVMACPGFCGGFCSGCHRLNGSPAGFISSSGYSFSAQSADRATPDVGTAPFVAAVLRHICKHSPPPLFSPRPVSRFQNTSASLAKSRAAHAFALPQSFGLWGRPYHLHNLRSPLSGGRFAMWPFLLCSAMFLFMSEEAPPRSWPRTCPPDLRRRFEEVLSWRSHGPAELWGAVEEWLTLHGVEAPDGLPEDKPARQRPGSR